MAECKKNRNKSQTSSTYGWSQIPGNRKGSKYQKQSLQFSFEPKIKRTRFALASKRGQIEKK